MKQQPYIPVITPLIAWIIKVTRRPTYMDEANKLFHDTVGKRVEETGYRSGASEDRRGVLYVDPRIDRSDYFRRR